MIEYGSMVIIAIAVIGLIVWNVRGAGGQRRAREEAAAHLGFRPCPDEADWLAATVTAIANSTGMRCEIRDPKKLPGEPAVYWYEKSSYRDEVEESVPVSEQEILFRMKKPASDAVVVAVKPSSLKPGRAARMVGTVATAPWDGQPDDLRRLTLPPDLASTNLIGAMGPPAASLYDLVDAGVISVLQGIGDAGGLMVRMRGGWCTVTGASAYIPFRLDDLVARIRPLL